MWAEVTGRMKRKAQRMRMHEDREVFAETRLNSSGFHLCTLRKSASWPWTLRSIAFICLSLPSGESYTPIWVGCPREVRHLR